MAMEAWTTLTSLWPFDTLDLELGYLTNTSNMAVRSGDAYLFGGDPARASLADGATSGSLTYRLPSAVGSASLSVWVFANNGFRLTVSSGNATGLQVLVHDPAPGVDLSLTDNGDSVCVYFGNNGNSQMWILHTVQIYTPSQSRSMTLSLDVQEQSTGEAWKVQLGQMHFLTNPVPLAALTPANVSSNDSSGSLAGVAPAPAVDVKATSGRRMLQDSVIACWQTSEYGRGAGTIPGADCPPGQEKDAGLCYPLCGAGYTGVGPVCWQDCPAGYTDIGAICSNPVTTVIADTSTCPWYNCCGLAEWGGYKCSDNCPAGYTWFGCTCTKGDTSFAKATYGRGVGVIPPCPAGDEKQAGLCYPPCGAGYGGVGPICWPTSCANPKFPNECGSVALCTTAADACSQVLINVAVAALDAIAAGECSAGGEADCSEAYIAAGNAAKLVADEIANSCTNA